MANTNLLAATDLASVEWGILHYCAQPRIPAAADLVSVERWIVHYVLDIRRISVFSNERAVRINRLVYVLNPSLYRRKVGRGGQIAIEIHCSMGE